MKADELLRDMHHEAWAAISKHRAAEDARVHTSRFDEDYAEFTVTDWSALLPAHAMSLRKATAQLRRTMELVCIESTNHPTRPRTVLRDLWPECQELLDASDILKSQALVVRKKSKPAGKRLTAAERRSRDQSIREAVVGGKSRKDVAAVHRIDPGTVTRILRKPAQVKRKRLP